MKIRGSINKIPINPEVMCTDKNMDKTSIVEQSIDNNDQALSKDQGNALLMLAGKNGYGIKDIKEYISFQWDLTDLKDIKYKHLLDLKKYLESPNQNAVEVKHE